MRWVINVSVLTLILLAAISCNQPHQKTAGHAKTNTAISKLTLEKLKNAEYQTGSIPDGKFQLIDGAYRKKYTPDSASEQVIQLTDQVVFGDLDAKDGQDAAVILMEEPGGSGTFYYLAAVINQNGNPRNVATAFIGDRVKINTLSIEGNQIIVKILTRRENEPMASPPTLEVTRQYKLEGEKLVEN
jgi:hypothetical protein